jgi:hypothetical protein
MKKLIKINFLVITAIVFCNIAQAQEKASDKSFNTVLNEVKQKQAIRNKMIQQMRQTTPINTSQNNNTDSQPASSTAVGAATTQQTTNSPKTNQQGTNNKPSNQPAKLSVRSKKQ